MRPSEGREAPTPSTHTHASTKELLGQGPTRGGSRSGSQLASPCLEHPTGAIYHTGLVKGTVYLIHFSSEETKTQRWEGIFLGSQER